LGNLDGGFADATNGLANAVGAFKDQAPVRIAEQGPYRSMATAIAGDTQMFEAVLTAGNVLFFSGKDLPGYLSKAEPAYKIYKHAKSAGVGTASREYLIGKSADILYKAADVAVQAATGGRGIPDMIESKIVPNKSKPKG
jgi:hypothetical protein